MDIKRRIGLSAGILAVGLGSGHVMQTRAAQASAERNQPTVIAGDAKPAATPPMIEATAMPTVILATSFAPLAAATATGPAVAQVALTGTPPKDSGVDETTRVAADVACKVTFDLGTQPEAMIGLALRAPCHAGERVVLRHAGLAVAARTSDHGALFLTLPALTVQADVSVLFNDSSTARASLAIPEAATMRRFAVQWMADDSFDLHAFEHGADYGMPGHVWAGHVNAPPVGKPRDGGFMTALGDPRVPIPMLAQVYTYPADPAELAELVIETVVSAKTCDRDLLGETIVSNAGMVTVTDLIVTMPGCDAAGDILVLKDFVPELTVAAAN